MSHPVTTHEKENEYPEDAYQAANDVFTFDEKAHAYFLNGKPLSGITTILGVISKPALIGWAARMACEHIRGGIDATHPDLDWNSDEFAVLLNQLITDAAHAHRKKKEDAAGKGTDLHALIEEYVRHTIDNSGGWARNSIFYSDDPNIPIKPFMKWAQDEDIRFLESEKRLYSKELAIAGTCDLVFEKDGKTYIGDIKTYKKLWDRTPMLQCAGYGLMYEEMSMGTGPVAYMGPAIHGYCVIRIKDDFEVKWSFDVAGDREGFLAALTLYRRLQEWAA